MCREIGIKMGVVEVILLVPGLLRPLLPPLAVAELAINRRVV